MQSVDEEALASFSLQRLPNAAKSKIEAGEIDTFAAIRAVLADFLLAQAAVDPDLERTERMTPVPANANLGSRVGRVSADGQVMRIYTFGFKDAFKATSLQILGIALTLFAGNLTVAVGVQALAAVKTLWEKLIVMKRPEDDNAIAVLESIGRIKAIHHAENDWTMPTTEEVLADAGFNDTVGAAALKWLESKKIIEATTWGGQSGDFSQLANRWRICL